MSKKIDMTGVRPNGSRLLVIGQSETKYKSTMWRCLCDCGKVFCTQGQSLRSGTTKSCGCLRKETCSTIGKMKRYEDGVSVKNNAYTNARKKARQRGLVFSLTKEEYFDLIESNCYYCGTQPKRIFRGAKGLIKYDYLCNGIDRVDSSKGYIKSNCITSCRPCNVAKSDMSQEQFLELIENIYHNIVAKK